MIMVTLIFVVQLFGHYFRNVASWLLKQPYFVTFGKVQNMLKRVPKLEKWLSLTHGCDPKLVLQRSK